MPTIAHCPLTTAHRPPPYQTSIPHSTTPPPYHPSRPCELFPQLHALRPKLFPEYRQFTIRYCAGREGKFGWDASGVSNSKELRLILEQVPLVPKYVVSNNVKYHGWHVISN